MKRLLNTQLVLCALICGNLFSADKHSIEEHLGKTPQTTTFQIHFDNTGNPNKPVTNATLTSFGLATEQSVNNFVLTNQKLAELQGAQVVSSLLSLENQVNEKFKTQDGKINGLNNALLLIIDHLNMIHKLGQK